MIISIDKQNKTVYIQEPVVFGELADELSALVDDADKYLIVPEITFAYTMT